MTTSRTSSARSRLRPAALLALLLLLAPAPARADQPDLTLFFSSDTRGMLRRCGCSEGQMGGLSARASYIKQNRVPGRTLVLDAGDTLFDSPDALADMREFYSLKARTILLAMKQSGYDAAAVGEYDLAYGKDFLLDAGKETGFTFLSANLSNKSRHPFKAALIRRFKGFKAGVIGVLDDAFPYGNFPESYNGFSVDGPAPSAKSAIAKLAGKADIIIVLAHLSVTDTKEFAKALQGADIVIQGHSLESLERPVEVGNTLIVKGFDKGKHIGRLDLWLQRDKDGKVIKSGHKIRHYQYQVITLDESIPPDLEVEGIIAGYRQRLKERAFTFERPDPAGSSRYVGPGKCRGCHPDAFGNWSATAHARRAFSDLEKTGDQYDPECLSCHTTGYGFASGYKAGGELGEVTCECCHGPGSVHAESGVDKPVPVAEKTCLGCHDDYQSPNFQFEKYKALGGAHRGK